MTTKVPLVVIVGGGFGGLAVAKELRHAPVNVLVIDRSNHHVFQPLLYQVATGILSEGQIAPATRDVLKKKNVSYVIAELNGAQSQQHIAGFRLVPYFPRH